MTYDGRINALRRRLAQGERDARLLDGRDFRDARWRAAERALASLEEDVAKRVELEVALGEVLRYQWAIGWTPSEATAAAIEEAYERARNLIDAPVKAACANP